MSERAPGALVGGALREGCELTPTGRGLGARRLRCREASEYLARLFRIAGRSLSLIHSLFLHRGLTPLNFDPSFARREMFEGKIYHDAYPHDEYRFPLELLQSVCASARL